MVVTMACPLGFMFIGLHHFAYAFRTDPIHEGPYQGARQPCPRFNAKGGMFHEKGPIPEQGPYPLNLLVDQQGKTEFLRFNNSDFFSLE